MAPTDESITDVAPAQLRCVDHDTPTLLCCASCETPLCPRCAVFTDVGQKCRTCTGRRNERKRRPAVPAVLAVVGILLALGGGVYLASDAFQSSTVSTAPTTTVPTARIGAEVTQRGLTYLVRSFECRGRQVGVGEGSLTAEGRYCFLDLKVSNTGDDPALFPGAEQFLIDSAGRRYAPDVPATFTHSPERRSSSLMFAQLNPGMEFDGVLVYDVGEAASVEYAELYTAAGGGPPSLFGRGPGGTRGVRVRLDDRD